MGPIIPILPIPPIPPPRRMKICDLTQFYSPVSGGVKRYLQEKAAYLHAHTTDDRHILIIPGPADGMTEEGRARTYTIGSPLVSRTSRYRALLRLEAVERILEREMPDVIESGDPYQVAWKAVASGRGAANSSGGLLPLALSRGLLSQRRQVLRPNGHGIRHGPQPPVRPHTLQSVCPHAGALARARRIAPGVGRRERREHRPGRQYRHLQAGAGRLRRPPARSSASRAGASCCSTSGRLAAEKNTRVLFDAFELLNRRQPGRFHLLAIGDGGQRAHLHDLQTATGAVTWLTYCADMAQLARYYRAADLFVHPGVQETFGLVALESQACGTPVVGIAGSYMDRIIFNSQQDWARENSAPALAHAIAEAADANLACTGGATSSKVRALYSWTSVFDRLFAIYRNVVKNYRQP